MSRIESYSFVHCDWILCSFKAKKNEEISLFYFIRPELTSTTEHGFIHSFDSLTVASLTNAKILSPSRFSWQKAHDFTMHAHIRLTKKIKTNQSEGAKKRNVNELESWNELKIYLRMLHAPPESLNDFQLQPVIQ